MKITIAGFGVGGLKNCLPQTLKAIEQSEIVIGSSRLLNDAGVDDARGISAVKAGDIADIIAKSDAENITVLMGGDSGFFSGTRTLLPLLEGYDVTVLPGVGSVSQFSAAVQIPWQQWSFCSAHGVECNAAQEVTQNRYTFFLTDGKNSADALCRELKEAGFGMLCTYVGCDLGYGSEQIFKITVNEAANMVFPPLSVLLIDNPMPYKGVRCGIPDSDFIRGDVPMTKSEVRAVVISKLKLNRDSILFDIGAGTGSVSCEAALLIPQGKVFAIEREPEGIELINENAARMKVFNLECVSGEAPDAIEGLPVPDAAFIGGSGGRLHEICDELIKLNPDVRIVIAAVSLETVAEAARLMELLFPESVETVMMQVSRVKKLGKHSMLMGQNPIYIISGGGLID